MDKNICPLSLIAGGTPKLCDARCKFCADNGDCFLAALIRKKATER